MAKRHRHTRRPAFSCPTEHPDQNYSPSGDNNPNYVPPMYDSNYPADQQNPYYTPQHLAPSSHSQSGSYPAQNHSQRRPPQSVPYYSQAGPQPFAQTPEPPPYQVNPATYKPRSKKTARKHAHLSSAYPQQRDLASKMQFQPEPPPSSPEQLAPGSRKPSGKNWMIYNAKRKPK